MSGIGGFRLFMGGGGIMTTGSNISLVVENIHQDVRFERIIRIYFIFEYILGNLSSLLSISVKYTERDTLFGLSLLECNGVF